MAFALRANNSLYVIGGKRNFTAMDNIGSLLDSARAAYKAGRYAEAWRLSKHHVLTDPWCAATWNLLGTLTVAKSLHSRAVLCFQRAAQAAGTHDPRILMNLGRALNLSGQAYRAKAVFESVLKADLEHYPAHYELARLHLKTSCIDQASPHLRVISTLAPLNWANLGALRKQLAALGQWRLAMEFEAAFAIRSGLNEENWVQLLKAANMAVDEKVTRAAMRRLLILRPQAAIVWKAIDAPHLVKGIRNEMLLVFRAAVMSDPIDTVRLLQWAYYFRVHNDPSGISLVTDTADRLGIHHPRLAAFRAWLHVKSGDLTALEVLVNKFIKADIDNMYAWNEL
ncbi:MAG: hypothetical protein VYE62_08635, partial [Pseudomonadota bacterium]|nr:hypothetical protein [Pseudomonadota bacterium]